MALQVIGAGFGRTGTMSMKVALERLGFGPCYHMIDCLPRGPEHWRLWTEAARGVRDGRGASVDWDTIFAGYASCVDFPVSTSWAALAERYPEAKVVLTVRNPDRWFDSTQETIFAPQWMAHLRSAEAGDMGDFIRATINDHFDDRMHDREHLVRRFREHVDEVRAAIPESRLLVFEVKDGWEPLGAFLDRPLPDEPLPNVNETAATREILGRIIDEGFEAAFGFTGT